MSFLMFITIMVLAIIIISLCMSMYDVYKGNVKKGAKHMKANLICNFIGTSLVAAFILTFVFLFIA